MAPAERAHRTPGRQITSSTGVIILLLVALLLAFTNPTKGDFVEHVLSESRLLGRHDDPLLTLSVRTVIENATARSNYAVLSVYRVRVPGSEVVCLGALGQFVTLRGTLQVTSLGQSVAVEIQTNRGAVTLELYPDLMPKTVANFVRLVEEGFYDGLSFHRVEDWLVQGGDPVGDGTGGPGWTIEFEASPRLTHKRGAVGMARNQIDIHSAGSQFYIVKQDATFLDGSYAMFGRVIEGMATVDRLTEGDEMISVTIITP